MRIWQLLGTLTLASLLCVGCSESGSPKSSKQELKAYKHGGGTAPTPTKGPIYVPIIKDATLAQYKGATIGSAFDKYRHLNSKVWNEGKSANGTVYVDFVGWLEGKNSTGVEVKFSITPTGDYGVAMVSRLDKDAKDQITRVPLTDTKQILDAIYADRAIKL